MMTLEGARFSAVGKKVRVNDVSFNEGVSDYDLTGRTGMVCQYFPDADSYDVALDEYVDYDGEVTDVLSFESRELEFDKQGAV